MAIFSCFVGLSASGKLPGQPFPPLVVNKAIEANVDGTDGVRCTVIARPENFRGRMPAKFRMVIDQKELSEQWEVYDARFVIVGPDNKITEVTDGVIFTVGATGPSRLSLLGLREDGTTA